MASGQPRRFAADTDTPIVVPLVELVDGKIAASHGLLSEKIAGVQEKVAASHQALTTELGHMRDDIKRVEVMSTREHAQVTTQLGELQKEIRGLRDHQATTDGSWGSLQKLGAALVGCAVVVSSVVALVVALTS